eukprot:12806686-Alexandrium_andersonii.AAC.1
MPLRRKHNHIGSGPAAVCCTESKQSKPQDRGPSGFSTEAGPDQPAPARRSGRTCAAARSATKR